MAYKIIGFIVWRGARFYMRRRAARLVPSRPVLAGTAVAGGVGALALAAAQRSSNS